MNTPAPILNTPALEPKPASASVIALSQVVFPRDTNELGLATAGVILKAIDITASLTAGKHTHQKVVTASLDRMDFLNPALLWDLVTTRCTMTQTWRSSLEVEVTVEAENTRTDAPPQLVAKGYLVFVALDDATRKPTAVAPLRLETDAERQRAADADARKASRADELTQLGQKPEILESEQPQVVVQTMTPDDSNIHQNVFGGVILELIHQAGQKAAFQHVNGPVIAVRQDRMSFEQPAYIGEEVKAQAVITRTWHTSLEIQVDVIARDYKTSDTRKVASSYLVYVAQNSNGKPRIVPEFQPRTPREEIRWEEAAIRRDVRMADRQDS